MICKKYLIVVVFVMAVLFVGLSDHVAYAADATPVPDRGNYGDDAEGDNREPVETADQGLDRDKYDSFGGEKKDVAAIVATPAPQGTSLEDILSGKVHPFDVNLISVWADVGRRTQALIKIKETLKQDTLIVVNDHIVSTEVAPVIIEGRTLVPIRAVANVLGATVVWNPETNIVLITQMETNIEINLNNYSVMVDNEAITLDVPVQLINNRTMVPLRFISETFKKTVEWDAQTGSVFIK